MPDAIPIRPTIQVEPEEGFEIGRVRVLLTIEDARRAQVETHSCFDLLDDGYCDVSIVYEARPAIDSPEPPGMLACGLVLLALVAKLMRGREGAR